MMVAVLVLATVGIIWFAIAKVAEIQADIDAYDRRMDDEGPF